MFKIPSSIPSIAGKKKGNVVVMTVFGKCVFGMVYVCGVGIVGNYMLVRHDIKDIYIGTYIYTRMSIYVYIVFSLSES
jgi:hypothetical protein